MRRTSAITALTSLLLCILLRSASAGTSYEILHSFADAPHTCPNPVASVIFDQTGNLYSTTSFWNGCVFELMPKADGHWKENTLYAFPQYSETGGAQPWAPVVFDRAGNLYGTTVGGGGSGCYNLGCGTIFELIPSTNGRWKTAIIYRFKDQSDGYRPEAGLAIDASGNLYGTTNLGGNLSCNPGYGCGTVFKLSKSQGGSWHKTTLHAFAGGRDGAYAWAGVILDSAGNLYGVTADCYETSCQGNGTVFELVSTSGKWQHNVLFRFPGGSNATPVATLTMDPEGNLYGTAAGAACCGAVFRLSRSGKEWKEEILHTFNGYDGAEPLSGVILDKDGNLFGTTPIGGNQNQGTAYELKHSNNHWTITMLHDFGSNYLDGLTPLAALAFGPDGALYGTTMWGGPAAYGTVFRIVP
jgi:uncharacterized repeat protein (TIGR03803 family)